MSLILMLAARFLINMLIQYSIYNIKQLIMLYLLVNVSGLQDYCKANADVTENENINIGMKLPLLVTGVAIAAIGVAVASLSRCR